MYFPIYQNFCTALWYRCGAALAFICMIMSRVGTWVPSRLILIFCTSRPIRMFALRSHFGGLGCGGWGGGCLSPSKQACARGEGRGGGLKNHERACTHTHTNTHSHTYKYTLRGMPGWYGRTGWFVSVASSNRKWYIVRDSYMHMQFATYLRFVTNSYFVTHV